MGMECFSFDFKRNFAFGRVCDIRINVRNRHNSSGQKVSLCKQLLIGIILRIHQADRRLQNADIGKQLCRNLADIEQQAKITDAVGFDFMVNQFCVFDFTICPAEGNVLPILIYTSSAMDEEGYRKLSGDVEEMMSQICRTVFGMAPEMKAGFLIADIEERLPRQLQLQGQGADKAGEQGNAASGSLHLQRAVQYIGEHYIENISMEDIAEHTKLSTSYLSHLFRQELHKNFVDYLTEVRMEQARRLIDQGIDNVNVLAEKVGYQYASYFCRQFKKYTGMTVGEYKRRK